jgi:hypothetical protein
VCVNTLLELSACRDGLPVACVVRGILNRSSHDEALAFARAVKHASGQNYMIGDSGRITDLECSANQVTSFWPKESADLVWHTNNVLQNDDLAPDARLALTQEGSCFSRRAAHSAARLESLRSRLEGSKVPRNVATAKATLAAKDSPDHPVCCAKGGLLDSFTFASTVMVLSEPPEFLVAPGPPDVNEYQRFTFA